MSAPVSRARRKAPHAQPPKERVVGLAAARAVLAVRPRDVLHIAYASAARGALGELLREAARQRIAYREVDDDELSRIAGTLHHEGICLEVRARPHVALTELAAALREGGFALALDQVQNPHNVGAILRSAGYFGACGLLLGSREQRGLGPAAVRVAEGGAEYVPVCVANDLAAALDVLSAELPLHVIGADAHEGTPLRRARFEKPCVVVLGNEHSGLSPDVKRRCTEWVHIPGTGAVESLNVSVAAGILLSHAAMKLGKTP